jgi:A/G-specific adenine glycosylase
MLRILLFFVVLKTLLHTLNKLIFITLNIYSRPAMKPEISEQILSVPHKLLNWYDKNKRLMPWRPRDGSRPDAYNVWLSEIMLQQTQVATAIPYFEKFLNRWPSIFKLAEANLDDVLIEWAGLGYYARARNLHRCAKIIVNNFNGIFPNQEEKLLELPGVGTYTAAAIMAIAFDSKATPMDGNFERVTARLNAIEKPLPAAKPLLKKYATMITPDYRPGDYAQAVMDLGATICTPKKPRCDKCPVNGSCLSLEKGKTEVIPKKTPKRKKPSRFGIAFLCINTNNEILLQRRPDKGLFAGMMEVPGTPWTENPPSQAQIQNSEPFKSDWQVVPGTIIHIFTHFKLEIKVLRVNLKYCRKADSLAWHPADSFQKAGLPSLMLKIIRHGLK